jgi:glyoxylase-like metal-dependent hydrolase (beta-lactamase superfamily II)
MENKMPSEIRTINLGFVNCHLVKTGDGFILVDTGIRSSRADLEKALLNAGCQPGNLKLIVLTHGDIDHTSNAAYLRQKYKTSIAMHRDDSRMVENGEMRPKRKVKSLFLRVMHVVMRISGGNRKMSAGFDRFTPDIYLEEGQSLKEYGFDATVLHLPGHTKGSIAILADNGDLISGDILENRGRPRPTTIVDDEAELAASLERLSKPGITTVYPEHGKPFAWEQFANKPNNA